MISGVSLHTRASWLRAAELPELIERAQGWSKGTLLWLCTMQGRASSFTCHMSLLWTVMGGYETRILGKELEANKRACALEAKRQRHGPLSILGLEVRML